MEEYALSPRSLLPGKKSRFGQQKPDCLYSFLSVTWERKGRSDQLSGSAISPCVELRVIHVLSGRTSLEMKVGHQAVKKEQEP